METPDKPKSFTVPLFADGDSGQQDDPPGVASRTAGLLDGLSAICAELGRLGCPAPPVDWAERMARLRLLRDYSLCRLRRANDRAEHFARSGSDPAGMTGTDLLKAQAELGGAVEALIEACAVMGCDEWPAAVSGTEDDGAVEP
jgi:hypothetical protein